jgi:hypothetical protein
MMRQALADVPADAPVPATEAMYVWDAAEGCWVTWADWIFAEARRNAAAKAVERPRGPRQAAMFRGWA